MVHHLFPLGLSICWGEWCGHSYCLSILWDTHKDHPTGQVPPWNQQLLPGICRTHLPPPDLWPPAANSHTRGHTTTARVRNEPTEAVPVLRQEHTFQCLPPPGASLDPQVWVDQPGHGSVHKSGQGLKKSYVWLFETPWTVALQGALSMAFSRQEFWRGQLFPSPEGFPDPGMDSGSPALRAVSLPSESPGKPNLDKVGILFTKGLPLNISTSKGSSPNTLVFKI